MKKRTVISLFLCIVICLSLTGCMMKRTKYSSHSFAYFDTVTTVTGYAKDQTEFDLVCEDIFESLGEYHRLFTIYHRYDGLENLCTVNELQNGMHRTVKVDKKIMDMLLFSKEMYRKTNGKVNIAMGSILSIWHDYREKGLDEPWAAELPPMERLQEAALHTDINHLILDEKNSTVTLADPLMTLDVGAIAKGYAVEMVARELEEQGVFGYVINVGGNVRTVGMKENGEKWTVGIENPDDNGEMPYLDYLYLSGESLVTSGSYQRYYTVGGNDYHHIIDPETLMPAERYRLISVVCRDSGMGDALSTALFCMDFEEGSALVKSLDGVEAMWVFADGTKKTSDGFLVYTQK